MEPRLPAHLEVSALIRLAGVGGGFASVLHKGERDAGTILVVLTERGANHRVYERMPTPDGGREWQRTVIQEIETPGKLDEWLARRTAQDPDLWIVELDIAHGERLIGLPDPTG